MGSTRQALELGRYSVTFTKGNVCSMAVETGGWWGPQEGWVALQPPQELPGASEACENWGGWTRVLAET